MKLLDTIKLRAEIEVINGLHIGGGKETVEIGGLDNQVIRHPGTKKPYIPGSSVKGKMRFLTEWSIAGSIVPESGGHGLVGPIHSCKNAACPICRIFGTMESSDGKRGPTRLLVRDAALIGDFDPEKMIEVKYATAIDRITGTAKGGSLRNMERVVPGTKFSFELIYRIFDLDDNGAADKKNFNLIPQGLMMIENDTLGGSGSRGCGKVAFIDINISGGGFDGVYKTTEELVKKTSGVQ
jgi:CRISPR-associated protein Csm3